MTFQNDKSSFLDELRQLVGARNVVTDSSLMRRFSQGFRAGGGPCLAVVQPGSLVEKWRVLQACVAANKIIIIQAANTGLTGGSTPDERDYDREIVLINTMRLKGIKSIRNGRQVICLPGATLYELERKLKPLGREPHSKIGSSCFGASVIGGICNNSGGALVQRGPAYTELALYARLRVDGRLELVNHLGVFLGNEAETILDRLERGDFSDAEIECDPRKRSSDDRYADHVRQVDASTPARFNADPSRLVEASGCGGKLAVFAVRLDTFEAEKHTQVFYVGTNDPAELTALRRHLLTNSSTLPISGEYMHRDAFDIAARYGKDVFAAIRLLGTDRLPKLFRWKAIFDDMASRLRIFPKNLSDRLMQRISNLLPNHLPERLLRFRDKYEHHLILNVGDGAIAETKNYLAKTFPSGSGNAFACTSHEAAAAFLHRFAVAGAPIRYRIVHSEDVEDIVALDIALRRNDESWFEKLPEDMENQILQTIYYGHFFCHVFHQDYVVRKGCDADSLKHRMLNILDQRGAEYPAEHNVGHMYQAKQPLAAFYRELDPCNQFNPGIGKTTKSRNWKQ